jgi:peptidoglycan/xylan/chitin deacetylase (PgdA/CDA1 family)
MSDGVYILNFHGIGQPIRNFWSGEEPVWIGETKFEAVLDEVKGREDVLVTFDDGNVSDIEIALPALQARGMKAHFYIVSDFVGQKGFLSVNDVKTLQVAGMVIGNHGKRHRPWRGMAAGELREELVEAKDRLEQIITVRIHYAACPYGEYDRRVLTHLRECGYERVYTSDGGRACKSRWLQPRNSLRCRSNAEEVRQMLGETGFNIKGLIRMCKRSIKRWR